MFAAASDVDNISLIDLLAVKRGHGLMCFDAVAAFGQAPETELIFIEAPEEHRAVRPCVSRAKTFKVIDFTVHTNSNT